jgi:hypothetical protein
MGEKPQKQAAGENPAPRWRWAALAIAVALLAWATYYFAYYLRAGRALDNFAQCLSSKGAKMYGAWWCPHCADQKQLFGHAFQYVNYIECSPPGERTWSDACRQAAVKHYPTWQFSDGSRIEGTQTLAALAQKTGCRVP